MSGNKNKGFSQTSKQYSGSMKEQQQQSRNKQGYHSPIENKGPEEAQSNKSSKTAGSESRK
ncbi:MAG: hypothetical protein ACXVCP_16570 [Bdellovibrio sp.]